MFMCVCARSVEGGRGGARWTLEDFVVLPCLRLDSLETDAEMEHWVQNVIGVKRPNFKGVRRQDWTEAEAHLHCGCK